jgi:phage-related protein
VTSIADAYVELHVDGDHIEGETRTSVRAAEKGVQRDFDKAGAALGQHMAQGFFKGFKIKNRVLAQRGALMGSSFAAGFTESLSSVTSAVTDLGSDVAKSMPSLRGLGIGALVASVPVLTSAVSALSGGLVAFVGSAAQASYASFGLLGVIGSLVQAKTTLKLATGGLSEALKGTEGAMAKLAPAAQKVVKELKVLAPAWQGLRRSVQGEVFRGVARELDGLGRTYIPVLRTNLTQTGVIANRVLRGLMDWAQLSGTQQRLGRALKGNNEVFKALGSAARPVLNGILRVYVALLPAARQLAERVAENARQFARFARSGDNMDGLFDKFVQGRIAVLRLWRITKNLGSVLRNVFGAAVQPGNNLLKTFVRLTGNLKRFTALASTKNAIADWAQKGIDVSGRLFRGLGKGASLLAPLFDPAILGKFMTVFENVLPVVVGVFQGVQAAVAPILDKVGAAFAENGPKFAKLFEAVAPLLSGIGSVIGELISQSLNFLGGIASAITPLVSVVSGFLGPILTKFAPIIAAIILAFVNWGSVVGKVVIGLVKFVPVIGRFLAPLIKLTSFILGKVGPVLRGLGKVVGVVFRGAAKVIGGTLRVAFAIVSRVFGFIGRYVGGVVRGVATAVGKAFGLVRTIVGKVVGGLWGVVSKGFGRVLGFIKKIPNKVLGFAASFLNAGTDLGKKIIGGIMGGLGKAKEFAGGLINDLKSAINGALNLPFTIKGPGPLPDFTIPAFRNGTNYAPGGLSLVGERGPELVDLPRGSKVKTASETRRIVEEREGGDGGGNVYIARMMPHNYGEFEKQVRARRRQAALGGRRVAAAS